MKCEHFERKQCPKCGKYYFGHSALSREDNQMAICPDCGTREALMGIGIDNDEIERILDIVHEHTLGEANV